MTNDLSILILAAGKGTRMKSDLPKVMHKVANREMLNLVIDETKILKPKNITIVISDEMEDVAKKISADHPESKINFAIQRERKGTAHAVSSGLEALDDLGDQLLILYGDTPLTSHLTMKKMTDKLSDFSLCVLGFEDKSQNAYGRLVVDEQENLEKIVEFKDANQEERAITLCNSGVIAVDGTQAKNLLDQVTDNNAAGEFYLTDIVAIAGNSGLKRTFIQTDFEEVLGVNSRVELAKAGEIKQNKIRKKMMDSGVTLLDPKSVYFSYDTEISNDVVIHPNVVFGPGVKISKDVEIKSFSHIEGAKIASGAVVGPFARLRPGTEISEDVRIGNFVEVKKSHLKKGAKINHLSYIGDSEIGSKANIGAGTITCNYDGYSKFKTKVGDRVFVGSNSSLVAPVEISDDSIVAAGSVITENIEKDALAFGRSRQTNIAEGGKKFHETNSKK